MARVDTGVLKALLQNHQLSLNSLAEATGQPVPHMPYSSSRDARQPHATARRPPPGSCRSSGSSTAATPERKPSEKFSNLVGPRPTASMAPASTSALLVGKSDGEDGSMAEWLTCMALEEVQEAGLSPSPSPSRPPRWGGGGGVGVGVSRRLMPQFASARESSPEKRRLPPRGGTEDEGGGGGGRQGVAHELLTFLANKDVATLKAYLGEASYRLREMEGDNAVLQARLREVEGEAGQHVAQARLMKARMAREEKEEVEAGRRAVAALRERDVQVVKLIERAREREEEIKYEFADATEHTRLKLEEFQALWQAESSGRQEERDEARREAERWWERERAWDAEREGWRTQTETVERERARERGEWEAEREKERALALKRERERERVRAEWDRERGEWERGRDRQDTEFQRVRQELSEVTIQRNEAAQEMLFWREASNQIQSIASKSDTASGERLAARVRELEGEAERMGREAEGLKAKLCSAEEEVSKKDEQIALLIVQVKRVMAEVGSRHPTTGWDAT